MNDHQTRLFVSAQGLRQFLQITTAKLEIIYVNHAILQVKVQKQPTKVAEIPLWVENIFLSYSRYTIKPFHLIDFRK